MLSLLLPLALATAPAAQPCTAADLSLATDGEGGAFNGMSHGGTLLVLRNIGARTCTVPALPAVRLRDAHGRDLPIARTPPVGMHPGPVMLPVAVAPGAEATAALRWVSGPVYSHGRCFAVATLAVAIGRDRIATPLKAQVCGAGDGAGFDQPALHRDPRPGD